MEDLFRQPGVWLDVRSPGEYRQGHVPGSQNLPLLTDDERAMVGTAYKKQGQGIALDLGLRLFGPKMADFLLYAKALLQDRPAYITCWRGGMRSQAVTAFLRMAGLTATAIPGGYKAFRRWVLKELDKPRAFHVLGGFSGSAKSEILREMKALGQQTLDLEELAQHRGSAFGALPDAPQPTQEQFENEIALHLALADPSHPIWVEDESRLIGERVLPATLYHSMQESPLLLIEKPLSERLTHLTGVYAQLPAAQLRQAAEKIRSRLGGERTQRLLALGEAARFEEAAEVALEYYDRAYAHKLTKRKKPITTRREEGLTHGQWAKVCVDSLSMTLAPS